MKWKLASRVIELRPRGLLPISFLLPCLLAVRLVAAAGGVLQNAPPTSPSRATNDRDPSCLEYRLPPGRSEKVVALARAENGSYFNGVGDFEHPIAVTTSNRGEVARFCGRSRSKQSPHH